MGTLQKQTGASNGWGEGKQKEIRWRSSPKRVRRSAKSLKKSRTNAGQCVIKICGRKNGDYRAFDAESREEGFERLHRLPHEQ